MWFLQPSKNIQRLYVLKDVDNYINAIQFIAHGKGYKTQLFMILPYFKEFLLQIRRQYYDNID